MNRRDILKAALAIPAMPAAFTAVTGSLEHMTLMGTAPEVLTATEVQRRLAEFYARGAAIFINPPMIERIDFERLFK